MVIVISFEGLPKVGKTTIASLVYEYYKIKGYDVLLYRETYSSEPGILALKSATRSEKRAFSTSFLFGAALMRAYEDILQVLGSYDLVVVDNFYSYYLLYVVLNDVNLPSVEDFLLKLTIPQIVIHLDADYDVIMRRTKDKENIVFSEALKTKEVYNSVKKRFRSKLAKRFPYKVIDLEVTDEEVFETLKRVKPVIDSALKGNIS